MGGYPLYQKAEMAEKKGNLEKAAKIYWENIFDNGTDARGNFDRLLIVLNRLGSLEEELKVAEIYLEFNEIKSERERISKRISRINKSKM